MLGSNLLVLEDLAKLPSAISCLVLFDEIACLVVRNDFFVIVVDEALELDELGFLGKFLVALLDLLDDLCANSRTVFTRRHKDVPTHHIFWGNTVFDWVRSAE